MHQTGLFILYTGNGKGKTTAAFGLAMRAAGHNLKTCIIQFIKGKWLTGEAKAALAFCQQIELHTLGTGFSWKAGDFEEVRAAALQAWHLAREKMASDMYDIIILDELTYLVTLNILSEEEIIDAIGKRPVRQHVVVTGRNAGALLLAAADLVTEMKEHKHPFHSGIKARKGIEY